MKNFFSKVQKTDTCWLWIGAKRNGYGAFRKNKKVIQSHRLSYEYHNGSIDNGLFVCHKCDVRNCVNPEHLFLGTQSENMIDCSKKGRLFISHIGFEKGHYPKNTNVSLEKAKEIKNEIDKKEKSLKSISILFDVKYQFVRDISCGRILKNY
ncbi:hypothetical protein CCP3SC1AL1_850005 [Gammaproteobacteria bacterium]